MGLLAADLEFYRSRYKVSPMKVASALKAIPPFTALSFLEESLDRYAGAVQACEKTASEEDHKKLWTLHESVEANYRQAVKEGKKPEADKLLDKHAGWAYLKGAPGQPGDLHPLPVPESK